MISWIKNHKLSVLLLLVVGYLLFNQFLGRQFSTLRSVGFGDRSGLVQDSVGLMAPSVSSRSKTSFMPPISQEAAPQPQIKDRLVVQNSNLSLLVKNVVSVKDQIINRAQEAGGYMVSVNLSSPNDAPTATVVVRVPGDQLRSTLEYFRSEAIKVVSENLSGYDVTDEFVDIEARIATQEKTKAKFEQILNSATEISDITNLTQQIIYVQEQIDSLKGQQQAFKQTAGYPKITIYLSTDEIALPYAPSETFRPAIIFKLAVRSLVSHLRQIATVMIWVGVYGVIWIPSLVFTGWLWRRMRKGQNS